MMVQSSSSSSSSSSHLPDEIITDILTRLPAKSVARFRCVSKPWLFTLTSKDFIETHLKLQKERQVEEEKLLLISPSHTLHTLNINSASVDDAIVVSKKLNFPPHLDNHWYETVGSCNGLVLAVNGEDDNELFLINPNTLEQVHVPKSPLALHPRQSFRMDGFGYDEISDEYKIVTLSYYDTDNEYEPDIDYTFVDVYCLRRGLWRRLESSPYDHAVPGTASGVFVGCALHWLAWNSLENRSVIAAFDLGEEKFGEIEAPKELDKGKFVFDMLVILGECLCMVVEQTRRGVDVWMMKEYGVEESWTKIITVNETDYFDCLRPLCLIGDDNDDDKAIVMKVDDEKMKLYGLKGQTSMDMVVDGAPPPPIFGNGCTFFETLICPR